MTMENVFEVVNLGKKYGVNDCLTKCETYLMDGLNSKDICYYYELAILYSLQKLELECELHIAAHTGDVLRDLAESAEGSRTVLSKILKLKWISCSETEVFHGCIAWVKAVTKQDQISGEIVRNQLGDLFNEIRFQTMTIQQFVAISRSYDDLFSLSEINQIVLMINCSSQKPRQIEWGGRTCYQM